MAASAGSDTTYGTGLLQPVLERYNLAHDVDEETETYITAAIEENSDVHDVQDLLIGFVPGYEDLIPQSQEQLAEELRKKVVLTDSPVSEHPVNHCTEKMQEHPPQRGHNDERSTEEQLRASSCSSEQRCSGSGEKQTESHQAGHDENVSEDTHQDEYPAAQKQLGEMFPSASAYLLRRVAIQYSGDVQSCALELVDADVGKLEMDYKEKDRARWVEEQERKIEEERQEKLRRQNLLKMFDERPEDNKEGGKKIDKKLFQTSADVRQKRKKKDKEPQIRYHDGQVVTKKGEKYINEVLEEDDPSTFVKLKIKTKGKRGPGYR